MQTLDLQLGQLQSVLEELVRLHERLVPVLEEKREALKKMNRTDLAYILVHEEAIAASIAVVDGRRSDIVRSICGFLGLDVKKGPIKLGDLIPKIAQEAIARELTSLRARLKELLDSVRRLSETIRALTEQSLSHVRFFLRILTGAEDNSPTYDRRARERQSHGYSVLDRKA